MSYYAFLKVLKRIRDEEVIKKWKTDMWLQRNPSTIYFRWYLLQASKKDIKTHKIVFFVVEEKYFFLNISSSPTPIPTFEKAASLSSKIYVFIPRCPGINSHFSTFSQISSLTRTNVHEIDLLIAVGHIQHSLMLRLGEAGFFLNTKLDKLYYQFFSLILFLVVILTKVTGSDVMEAMRVVFIKLFYVI